MKFRKFHAAGNAFLVLSENPCALSPARLRHLCSLHYGLGADGVVAIEMKAGEADVDFELFYWNADGEIGTFCGNGARLAVWLAYEATGRKSFLFSAADGLHEGWVISDSPPWIGVTLELRRPFVPRPEGGVWVDTGSPHLLMPVKDEAELRELPLASLAPPLRRETTYDARGVNVSFYAPHQDGYALRTYERGVEAETQSCGSAAVALAAFCGQESLRLYPPGGSLQVLRLSDTRFRLEGPLSEIAQGKVLALSTDPIGSTRIK